MQSQQRHQSGRALAADDRLVAHEEVDSCYRVHLCFGPNCSERGSRVLLPILEQAIQEAGLSQRVELLATTCRNRCDYGPSLNVYPGPVFYNQISEIAIHEIVDTHLAQGRIATRWLYRPRIEGRSRR
jgi:(2Fe-2S) ferredoxin